MRIKLSTLNTGSCFYHQCVLCNISLRFLQSHYDMHIYYHP